MNERKNTIVTKNKESQFQRKLRATGIPFLSALRFQIFRIVVIVVITTYYVIIPFIQNGGINVAWLAIPILLSILTEPGLKFTPVAMGVENLVNRKKKLKVLELFTLFDILKADLSTLKESQEVNIYGLLRDAAPMFEHIGGTLSRFLSLWKTSPHLAKDVFQEEIGGESAKVLGDILYKLDQTSKEEALSIIESESTVFSFSFYEGELQSSGKQKMGFYMLFMSTNVLIIVWLIVLIFSVFNDTITNNNLL